MKVVAVFCALLIPTVAGAEEVRIAVGMPHQDATKLIRQHSGKDITAGLALATDKTGIFWEFKDYDVVVELDWRDGKIVRMTGAQYQHAELFLKHAKLFLGA
jgi:hypothetical protein